MTRSLPLLAFASILAVSAPTAKPADTHPGAGDLRRSGTVRLDISCKPEVKEDFQTAVALLHSFFYDEARRRFDDIARRDPDCAMAWWGQAMTWYHPVWAPPTPAEIAGKMERMFQHDLGKCRPITEETWSHRGFSRRFAERFSWLFKPLI